MHKSRFLHCIVLTFLCVLLVSLASQKKIDYEVVFDGSLENQVQKELKKTSVLLSLQSKPVTSLFTLRRRMDQDLKRFHELFRSLGYYDAKITASIDRKNGTRVLFHITLGKQYLIESCKGIISIDNNRSQLLDLSHVANNLPSTYANITDIEKQILVSFKERGYACTNITDKKVVADCSANKVFITFYVDRGTNVTFGKTLVFGNKSVKEEAIKKNIPWNEGQIYSPNLIDIAQKNLESSGLFSSVVIKEQKEDLSNTSLPIEVHLSEAKHRSIGAGVSYTRTFGPGILLEWENRNLCGEAKRLLFKNELWWKSRSSILSLTQPHFKKFNQNLIWVLEYNHFSTVPYTSTSQNASVLIERKLSSRSEVYAGLRLQRLVSKSTELDRTYFLFKVPLQFKISSANNLLDPTNGTTLNTKLTPSFQFVFPSFPYTIHLSTLSHYCSFFDNRLTIALKGTLGNIKGASRHDIPTPDRLYGGSDNSLRGYKAQTVSPLNHHSIPIGGKSMLTGTCEARFRSRSNMGFVLFYDIGNVYSTNLPKPSLQQLQSVGCGIRYTTPIGPLRLDIAVPLNPRKKIDPLFQIYFSIGQAF